MNVALQHLSRNSHGLYRHSYKEFCTQLRYSKHWKRAIAAVLAIAAGLPVGSLPGLAQADRYCHLPEAEATRKQELRRRALTGNEDALKAYNETLRQHARLMQDCRRQSWLQHQAVWLRLYPCDLKPGSLDTLFDSIVDRGYNQVYVEVFYDGRVLLPAADNPTPWTPVVTTPGYEDEDLLALAIQKGRDRGLEVHAWMFTMHFGYTYARLGDRQGVLARNGRGQTSLTVRGMPDFRDGVIGNEGDRVFIDPYHAQARQDYAKLVGEVAQRNPDGILFDYIRYLRGTGTASVAANVKDLWIYGEASQRALFDRAQNRKGLELIRRYVRQGYITTGDLQDLSQLYPNEGEPMWQGRSQTFAGGKNLSLTQQQSQLQTELWYLAVAHAVQGVLDFLGAAVDVAGRSGVSSGAVFFPNGNRPVGQTGYDSRLQPWDRFPTSLDWHPMAYANCGNTGCILEEVQRVLAYAPRNARITPALAGVWGEYYANRPPLEQQMLAIRRIAPQIKSASHFAYSWQFPQSDRERKFCQL